MTFFPDHCVFQEIRIRGPIDIGRKYRGLYHWETGISLVACVSSTFLPDFRCQFGHPTLQVLKKLVPKLGQVSSIECESYQIGKHHHVPYPLRVNKMVDHPFKLVHSNIWGPCPVSSTLDLNILFSVRMTFLV